jgi:hypothetical protein
VCVCVCVCVRACPALVCSSLWSFCVLLFPIHGGHSAIDNHRNIDSEIRAPKEWYRGYRIIETVVIFLVKCKRWEPSPSTAP